MSPELRRELRAATENLLYPSETDAEFEVVELASPFPWEERDVAVEVVEVRQFFAELREGPDAAGYHALYGLLTGRLGDLKIHRVGEVEIDIYLTGVEPGADGLGANKHRVGLKTHAVET